MSECLLGGNCHEGGVSWMETVSALSSSKWEPSEVFPPREGLKGH